jgi:hypothetical protein
LSEEQRLAAPHYDCYDLFVQYIDFIVSIAISYGSIGSFVMELRHLRYFMAVASAQSFTKAAAALHVSQPSLSVQIRALEDELGSRLFDRLGRKVSLTQAGEVFHDHAERAVRELERAAQLVREVHGA